MIESTWQNRQPFTEDNGLGRDILDCGRVLRRIGKRPAFNAPDASNGSKDACRCRTIIQLGAALRLDRSQDPKLPGPGRFAKSTPADRIKSISMLTLPTKVPSDSLGRIGSLKRTSDKCLFPMALGSCGHRITHLLRPINMNGRSILSVTSML